MKIIEIDLNYEAEEESVIALGNFDGVHRGHIELISKAIENAKKLNIKSSLLLFRGCENFMEKTAEILGIGHVDFPSLGSGGGCAWALFTYFKAKITEPMDYILEKINFKDLIKDMDYLILGEDLSQFNAYSSINMAKLAKRYND